MKTFGQLRDSIISQVWPSGQPEGLETGHGLIFQEGMSKIAEFVGVEGGEEFQSPNVDIIRFCKTQYKCGMTVVEAPRGIIRRVFTLCADQWCDPVYFKQVKWPGPEWLGRRSMIYVGQKPAGGTAIRLGVSEASSENDATCGRARGGVWAIYQGNIYISPWLQSTEALVIEWEGLKNEWSDDDPVDQSQGFRNCLKMFYQYGHERDYGSPERAMQFHNPQAMRDPMRAGAFDLALAELLWRVRDMSKVRETAVSDEPVWLLDGTFDRCLPPAAEGALLLGHIGNYGVQGYGESDVASLLANMGVVGLLASGTNPAQGYDVAVGQFFHSLLFPYGGAYGQQGEKNAVWPAPSAQDWALNTLDDFKTFFTLPNNERYYDICLGTIHLFVIDSNADDPDGITDTSAQGIWLKAKLALSASPWKVVLMSSYITLPYADWGADMVLATAAGFYERLAVSGVPVITNGLGGNHQTGSVSASTGSLFLQQPGVGYGAGRLIATRCSLRYEMVLTSGALIDSVQINKAAVGECASAPIAADVPTSTIEEFLPPGAGGGTVSQQFFTSTGNPNGVVTAGPLPAVCYDKADNVVFYRDGGSVGNTGWY